MPQRFADFQHLAPIERSERMLQHTENDLPFGFRIIQCSRDIDIPLLQIIHDMGLRGRTELVRAVIHVAAAVLCSLLPQFKEHAAVHLGILTAFLKIHFSVHIALPPFPDVDTLILTEKQPNVTQQFLYMAIIVDYHNDNRRNTWIYSVNVKFLHILHSLPKVNNDPPA